MSQYTIPLLLPADYSSENFISSACNEEAIHWIQRWPNWSSHALLLVGPTGCGKSHLGHMWATTANAITLSAETLGNDIPDHNYLVEDINKLRDERALLHLFNYSRENKRHLLLTSASPIAQLEFTLPDLISRLKALPVATIKEADDDALAAAMRKQFADRQIKVDEDVIAFLTSRMERSFAHLRALVEHLDKTALEHKRNLTIPFIKHLLDKDISAS